jgi:hypothetical protein
VDLEGNRKEITVEQWRTQAGTRWVWNAERLRKPIEENDELYRFGGSRTMYEFLALFDRLYYLRAIPTRISERLRSPARDNHRGRDAPQRNLVLNTVRDDEETARKVGFEFVEASVSSERIFQKICREDEPPRT